VAGRSTLPKRVTAHGSRPTTTCTLPTPALINPVNFLLATRDTGYKSTAFAIAELIDNSLEARARKVSVQVSSSGHRIHPIEIAVIDNGVGMDSEGLAAALTFGGSTRFGSRDSLGRYGMGLPNGSLSRARRVEVYTWRDGEILVSRLDVDELVAGARRTLPKIESVSRPSFLPRTRSGTAVRLLRCDQIEYRRRATLCDKLEHELGRIYREFIGAGLDLRLNSKRLSAFDPLFLSPAAASRGARAFGQPLMYRLEGPSGVEGEIRVRFSELPIERWQHLNGAEKRATGITNAPTISISRARREIDRGWFFMGSKRRENYDDWWRCEISFDPVLDEHFGITHSKQEIRPTPELSELLARDLEPIARALNSRVRRRFEQIKIATPLTAAERQAARANNSLPSLPKASERVGAELRAIVSSHETANSGTCSPYRIIVADLPTTSAFEVVVQSRQLFLLLNAHHPLYRDLYSPLAASDLARDQEYATKLALTLLAAARAEVAATSAPAARGVRRFRRTWADVLATFYNA
jgi:hypothetical protein